MSLYGALRAGVAGLAANSQRIGMISDNIANSNTTSYKRVDARFSTFVTETQSNSGVQFSNGGVRASALRNVGQQGLITPTSHETDLAILGDGYFVVAKNLSFNDSQWEPSGGVFYSRSGGFRPDENGNLRNGDGHYLLSWPNNREGTNIERSTSLEELRSVNVGQQNSRPIPSTVLALGANLLPQDAGADSFKVQYQLNDSKGRPHDVELTFERIPSETQSVFFDNGSRSYEKSISTTVTNGWRVYSKFTNDDIGIQTYDAEGNEAGLIRGNDLPIADVVFDASGKLSNIALPGALSFYKQTALPIDDGALTEDGSTVAQPYNFPAGTITQAGLDEIADILRDSGVAASTFTPPVDEVEILDGIELLDTDEYPDAMGSIMAVFNRESAFENSAARDAAGYPDLNEGIDEMSQYWLNNGTDTAGEAARNDPSGRKYLAGRLINGGNDQIATSEDVGGNSILSPYSSNAGNRVQFTIDYDGNGGDDGIDIDINFGSMTMAALESNGAMNRSSANVSYVGEAGRGNDGLTQYYDGISTIRYVDNNGKSASGLANIDINEDGLVSGRFTNGESRELSQVPLVVFANPNGLAPAEGLAYVSNRESGEPLIRLAGTGGAGDIIASALEGATVDIAEEFSNMIVTQRGFSASAKILSTTQAMIEELSQRL